MLSSWFQRDGRVVRRVLQGERAAFDGLVERYMPMVYAQAYGQTRCREDALDIAQESFLKAFQTLDTLKEPDRFAAWLRTITRYQALDFVRKRQRDVARVAAHEQVAGAETPNPGREELLALLRQQITQLDEGYREIILLFYFSGKNLNEVARGLGISRNAANKRLQRARQALGAQLVADMTSVLEQERFTTDQCQKVLRAIAAATAPWWAWDAAAGAVGTGVSGMAGVGQGVAWKIAFGVLGCAAILGGGLLLTRESPLDRAKVAGEGNPVLSPTADKRPVGSSTPDGSLPNAEPGRVEEPENDTAGRGNVRGIVIDETGAPVRGALVWAAAAEKPMVSIQQQSARDGAFAFDLEPGQYWLIRARVNNRSGGYNGASGVFKVREMTPRYEGVIRLAPQGTLHGRILDAATGAPIPHAALWLDEGRRVEAGGQGRFEAHGVVMSNHYAYVIAPGYERKRILFDTSLRERSELDCYVSRGGSLQGRVTDAHGNPIPNAQVYDPGSGDHIALAARHADVRPDGSYVRDGLAFDVHYRFAAEAPGYAMQVRYVQVTPTHPQGAVNFVLETDPDQAETEAPARTAGRGQAQPVTGFVHDIHGQPVAGARIQGASLGGEVIARTDATGRFVVPAAEMEGEMFLSVVTDRFAPCYAKVQSGELDVQLEPGPVVSGTVVDDRGAPIEGVWVVPTYDHPDPALQQTVWLNERSATTDASGFYAIGALPEVPLQFDFMKPGLSAVRDQTLALDGADNTTTMLAGGAIRGKVVDSHGDPVRQFKVLLSKVQGTYFAGFSGIGVDYTADDGVFVLTDVDAGNIVGVTVTAPGYRDATLPEVPIVPLNRLPDPIDLHFVMHPREPVDVFVHDQDGRPIPNTRIVLLARDPNERLTWGRDDQGWARAVRHVTGSGGRVRIGDGGMHQGSLLARADGYARQNIPWPADGSLLDMTLAPEAVIEGQLARMDLSPSDTIQVTAGDGLTWSETLFVPRDGDGRFQFKGLPAGPLQIRFSAPVEAADSSGPDRALYLTVEPGEVLLIPDLRLAEPGAN